MDCSSNQYLRGSLGRYPRPNDPAKPMGTMRYSVAVLHQGQQTRVLKWLHALQIKFYGNAVITSHLSRIDGCFCAARSELRDRSRDHMARQPEIFTKKLATPCSKPLSFGVICYAAIENMSSLETFRISVGPLCSKIS